MKTTRILIGALAVLLVSILPLGSQAAAAEPERQSFVLSWDDCAWIDQYVGPITISATLPPTVRQGESFTLENVTLEGVPDFFATGSIRTPVSPPPNAAGSPLVLDFGAHPFFGPQLTSNREEPYTATWAAWGDVGDTIDIVPGPLYWNFTFNGFQVGSPALCGPVINGPAFSVLIEPPANGGPITDELLVRVIDGSGGVVFEHRSFVTTGDFRFRRDVNGTVTNMAGIATVATDSGTASARLASAAPNALGGPSGALFEFVDPSAGLTISGGSSMAHLSSRTRESIAGFAVGTMNGAPVGIYWSVRDLAR